jgi:Ca2+-binding RTX toxin-like protein
MATIYVSPLGSGNASGSSAANAMAFTNLDAAIAAAGAGGTVRLLADKGSYNVSGSVNIDSGGTDVAPVTIMGVDSAGNPMDVQIYGTRPAFSPNMADDGNIIFKLLDGANNLTFENIDFHNVQMAFRLGGNIHNITIENMAADNVAYFVGNYVLGTAMTATVTGLTIRDVNVNGFSKAAIMLGHDTNNVTIDNVYADSGYEDASDVITMGIHLDGTVHDVLIKNCTMLNSISAGSSSSYWNGDGYCTEADTYSVRFENCVAAGNGDAGFDVKSANAVLEDCTSRDNGRNFRLWDNAQLINCTGLDPHIRGGSTSQLQIWVGNGAHVTVTGGHFDDSGSATKVAVTEGTGSSIAFSATEFTHAWNGSLTAGSSSSITGMNATLIHEVIATGVFSTNGSSYLSQTSWLTGTTNADLLTSPSTGSWTVNALAGNDTITTSGGNDLITAGAGDDVVKAASGDDVIRVGGIGDGYDAVDGGAGFDRIVATQGNTNIGLTSVTGIEEVSNNGYGSVWIMGSSGNDMLDFTGTKFTGIKGIKTGTGDDTIYGSTSNDLIVAGAGTDTMSGNAGADLFKFAAASETKVAAPDKILDFQPGTDDIDLSSIDANPALSGNQAFKFLGSNVFTHHAGELRLDYNQNGFTMVQGDVNGDGVTDFAIQLTGKLMMTASDFIL